MRGRGESARDFTLSCRSWHSCAQLESNGSNATDTWRDGATCAECERVLRIRLHNRETCRAGNQSKTLPETGRDGYAHGTAQRSWKLGSARRPLPAKASHVHHIGAASPRLLSTSVVGCVRRGEVGRAYLRPTPAPSSSNEAHGPRTRCSSLRLRVSARSSLTSRRTTESVLFA